MSPVKRFLAFTVLACLLLCGCQPADPTPTDSTTTPTPTQPPVSEAPTPDSTPTPEPSAEVTPAPTQPGPKLVTVYLLEKSTYFDSGSSEYYYDENYNIDSYTVFTIENEPVYTAHFEEKDSNGMACRYRAELPDDSDGEIRTLTYFADGKLKEEQLVGSNFTGYQYEYNQKGDVVQKREYYDGILESVVYYEYEGEVLKAVYGEDRESNRLFDCRVENGLIMEKVCYQDDSSYSYLYKYDENNILVESAFFMEGENMPSEQYYYRAVEVEADRAWYLLAQQRYLLPIV